MFETALVSQATPDVFQVNPTLVAGDVQVSKDGGSFANIHALPTAIDAGSTLTVALTATEMDAGRVVVRFNDQAGNEWHDRLERLFTSTRTFAECVSDIITALLALSPIKKAVQSQPLSLYRGDTWTQQIRGLGDLTGYDDIWFGMKGEKKDTDAAAVLLISETVGLEVIDGAPAGVPADGSIAVVGAATDGVIEVTLEAVEAAKIDGDKKYSWDVQVDIGGTITTPRCGKCYVTGDIVRATS